ncbi:MAG: hypothetical protein ACLTER_12205 [Ruminococcus sp.]
MKSSDMKSAIHILEEEQFKMAAYYLAVDIRASSGRHILGHMENGKWFWKKSIVLKME